jgi:AraC-like DNA-binding protein
MPIFRDPDSFVEAVGPQARMITKGPFWAQRATSRNGPVACTHVKMSPTTYEVDSRRTGTTNFVFLDEGTAPLVRNCVSIGPSDMLIWPARDVVSGHSDHPSSYSIVAIPDSELDRWFDEPLSACRIRPSALSLAHLRRVHRAAMAESDTQHGLSRAVVECIEFAQDMLRFRTDNRRSRAVLRFVRLLDEHRGIPLSLAYICSQLAITPRTLERYCVACLGVGPDELEKKHRLHEVRRQLIQARAGTTVADVALIHGFSHLSRFAREYQQLFGQLPSATLRESQAVCRKLS